MIKYQLLPTKGFQKQLKKLSKDLLKQTYQKLNILQTDPSHPSLRTKINRSWSSYLDEKVYECSVNMSYRIFFYYKESTVILLLAIGSHDIVDK